MGFFFSTTKISIRNPSSLVRAHCPPYPSATLLIIYIYIYRTRRFLEPKTCTLRINAILLQKQSPIEEVCLYYIDLILDNYEKELVVDGDCHGYCITRIASSGLARAQLLLRDTKPRSRAQTVGRGIRNRAYRRATQQRTRSSTLPRGQRHTPQLETPRH